MSSETKKGPNPEPDDKTFDFNKYLEAAERGDAEAQYKVAEYYYNSNEKSETVDEEEVEGSDNPEKESGGSEAGEIFREVENADSKEADGKDNKEEKKEDIVRKNKIEAFKWYVKAAGQGYADAQYMVGECYLNGVGAEKNKIQASRWFKKAAEQGHAKAKYKIGEGYLNRNGVEIEAFKWFMEAAELGLAEAQYKVGYCYYYGKGIEREKAEAFKWFVKAAEQGQADAQYMLGECYSLGEGVQEDRIEAFKWYEKAAEQGKRLAQLKLGNCCWNGKGVPIDKKEARKWWLKAVDPVTKVLGKIGTFIGYALLVIFELLILAVVLFYAVKFIGWVFNIDFSSSASKITGIVKRPYYDVSMCMDARRENSIEYWKGYLKKFPEGWCAVEAQSALNNMKKTGTLEWSELFSSEEEISWYEALEYCDKLEEDGYSDWRLPNIDELRMLIKNCPATESGGKCQVREDALCLFPDCANSCSCEAQENNGDYYSKLGDSMGLWSFSSDSSLPANAWVVDFDSGGIEGAIKDEGWIKNVRCVRQDDHDACETAKKYEQNFYWYFYLDKFPNGECAGEAKAFKDKEDEKACDEARSLDVRFGWELYLRGFSDGKCAEEGNLAKNKFGKIDGFEWSDVSTAPMLSFESAEYCKNLEENGHDDWRLPNIDELRTLIKNHPGTVPGGRCRVSEEYEKTTIDFDLTESCKGTDVGIFSKLGDFLELWSSTVAWTTTYTEAYGQDIWLVDFGSGGINADNSNNVKYHVRCIRQDDADACEKARNDQTAYSWKRYLEYFPEGECADEANAGPKDEVVCKRARQINTRAEWESYLHDFPNGKCAKEAKVAKNKFKKTGNLEWSDILEEGDCDDLVEDGHSDWRLPNIDELRLLVQNHPGTISGGICDISEKNGQLDDESWDENCGGIEGDNFSKFGDTDWFRSSSVHNDDIFWAVSFDDGSIYPFSVNFFSLKTRCVRKNK